MKKTFLLLLALLCLLTCFVACQNEKQNEEPSNEQNYFFVYQSVKVTTDNEAAPLLEALGAPIEKTISPSCYFGDINDVLYVYQGLEVTTFEKDGKEYLYSIELVNDTIDLKTPEGIGVGASRQAVVKAYGEPDSTSSAGAAIYRGKTMPLNFF